MMDNKNSTKNDRVTVSEIFEDMSYGPAPEASDAAKEWICSHGGKFGHFIGNKYLSPHGRKTLDSVNPADGSLLATTIQGTEEDVDFAVRTATEAFEKWTAKTPYERSRILYSIARHVQKHHRLLAVVEALDNGKPIRETRDCDLAVVIRHLYHHAGWAQFVQNKENYSSIGVVGAIVPWNFPLMLLTWKVAPALAMGNTVVLKPASYTRLSALLFAEICAEAGLPSGVFNVVTGSGAIGSSLAIHPLVGKVAFTGSTEVGKILRRITAGTGKKLSLELGGKSPIIVYDSADLDSVVEGVVDAIWFNQGQVCSAGSRLLIQETVFDVLVEKLKHRLTTLRLGDSLDKAIDMGAIIHPDHKLTIDQLVDEARNDGAEVHQNYSCLPTSGCYYPPTLVTKVQTVSRIVAEEVFGPVLVALPFRTAKEAVALANNSRYGLGGSVWSEFLNLSLETAMQLKAGSVWINSHNLFDAASGFGGYKESGFGRDGGFEGLKEYAKPKWQRTKGSYTCTEEVAKTKMENFGKHVPGRPTFEHSPVDLCDTTDCSSATLRIDKTYKLYYGGAQKRPDGMYSQTIVADDGSLGAVVPDGNRKDVRNCVEAASKAKDGWAKKTPFNRSQIMYYIAENLEQRQNEMAELLLGLQFTRGIDDCKKEVAKSVERLFYWAGFADKYGGTVQETQLYGMVTKVHEPVGVVAVVCNEPNSPLLSLVSAFAPLVARGNVAVLVPCERYPVPALDLYKVFDTSDVPAGVINILTGNSDHLTKYLAEHQDVQGIWYFGSEVGSKFVEWASAESIKRTWVNYGEERDWFDEEQGCGQEFLERSVEVKNIWLPTGHTYAN